VASSPHRPRTASSGGSDPRLGQAATALWERARRLGPLPYSALGIYPPADLPGVPELAAWEERTIGELWDRAGRPDPFTVVHVGAGDGSVPAAMLGGAARLGYSAALRLVLVEADPRQREQHARRLPVESPALFLGPVTAPDDPEEDPGPATGIGPIVTSLSELPVVRGWCAVLAIGWLSRFPYDLFEWRAQRWHEVRLAAALETSSALETITVGLDADRASRLDGLIGADARPDGACYAVRPEAATWLRSARGAADSGWVIAADTWVERTAPVSNMAAVPVALDQLSMICRPEAAGEEGPGGLEVVRWGIG
jgi:hypothetical protein